MDWSNYVIIPEWKLIVEVGNFKDCNCKDYLLLYWLEMSNIRYKVVTSFEFKSQKEELKGYKTIKRHQDKRD